ncbi:endonuclease/exonuclease/phosphatase family protein [Streptomyces sp. UNOC14_S4]|uniref:endonuclease/exonuclease/phosphatase family protein n=1 Tax=Streptomyces sp. UNOC14_S4 TaxID=2872340 RepID=UPI001E3A975D|nr:endonuclease/exonuclease/phosphatase family protein [Streptomyces sp. UNOC14_S4]MCC3766093.1 endonuclease/exonuclease/phosphatase family protein [Streptomyces sp. UNOC14_S4]
MNVRFGTYNLYKLAIPRAQEERNRYEQVVRSIRTMGVHVLAVQEIIGAEPDDGAKVLWQLADDTGLTCTTAPDPTTGTSAGPALASSQHHFHTGLLWHPDLTAVPGGWRAYNGAPDFWHSLATLVLDAGGPPVKFASFHADPFRPDWRYNEARRVTSAFRAGVPGAIGADWNAISADHRTDGTLFDDDPYTAQDHIDLEYQVEWREDPTAPPKADRRASEVLRRGGLLDTAAVLDVPWEPTTGHWTDGQGDPDRWGPRRIDTIRITDHLVPALRAHRTVRTPDTLAASDHLPVVVDLALAEVAG